ncbi:Protein DA1-related 1, partial [Cucurbita argyrosperma subsp. sororia]
MKMNTVPKAESEDDEQSTKGESDDDDQITKSQLEEDERLAKAQMEEDDRLAKLKWKKTSDLLKLKWRKMRELPKLNWRKTSRLRSTLVEDDEKVSTYQAEEDEQVCAGCHTEIGHGRFLSCMGAVWHPECFRCNTCNEPITDHEFSMSGNRPYHKSCFKEQHHPRSRDTSYLLLDDGRKLCLECLDSAIMDTHECQPLYLEIQEFYEGLNMKVEQQVPMLLVERQALNEAMVGEKNGHHHLPETRGLCLSEEQTVCYYLQEAEDWSRLLTGSILAHEMMHAWLRLKGYPNLKPEVEEGICQVLAHMWVGFRDVFHPGKWCCLDIFVFVLIFIVITFIIIFFVFDVFKEREGNQAVSKYGLKRTLDHIRLTGTFP